VSTKALWAGIVVLVLASGCGGDPPEESTKIPPTPTVNDFQGVTSEAPLDSPRPASEPGAP
jgi:hypothetical protein